MAQEPTRYRLTAPACPQPTRDLLARAGGGGHAVQRAIGCSCNNTLVNIKMAYQRRFGSSNRNIVSRIRSHRRRNTYKYGGWRVGLRDDIGGEKYAKGTSLASRKAKHIPHYVRNSKQPVPRNRGSISKRIMPRRKHGTKRNRNATMPCLNRQQEEGREALSTQEHATRTFRPASRYELSGIVIYFLPSDNNVSCMFQSDLNRISSNTSVVYYHNEPEILFALLQGGMALLMVVIGQVLSVFADNCNFLRNAKTMRRAL